MFEKAKFLHTGDVNSEVVAFEEGQFAKLTVNLPQQIVDAFAACFHGVYFLGVLGNFLLTTKAYDEHDNLGD